MPRPKFYRDPVHLQIRYDAVDLARAFPAEGDAGLRIGWLVRKLVDCPEFQRLRHIRQNGLTNLVFHGAEHSRFAHSMGVAHLAREMYAGIERNSDAPANADHKVMTCVAALLHDVGHGPFSHTLEEILKEHGVEFDHEIMTQRIIEEDDSAISTTLKSADPALPTQIVYYIDKKRRREAKQDEHWRYRLVSSQLDADRLDYLLRDALFAGMKGGFDLSRLLDSLQELDGKRIAVDRGSIVTVEAYLVTLDQMYRAVYYHHATRAASVLLSSTMRRAFELHRRGDPSIFPPEGRTGIHPLQALAERGQAIALHQYMRLGEFQVWSLIESWKHHPDAVLSDLAGRLLCRRLFKTIDVDAAQRRSLNELEEHARSLTKKLLGHVDDATVGYYVSVDEPGRTSYKQYDWRSEWPDESIWLVGEGPDPRPIEDNPQSRIVAALKETKYFHRLVFPEEIRASLLSEKKPLLKKLQGGKG
ncbi:HD domain-containing protein [Sorangium sp. So ce1036]|uniref:HD domain-containing protein n=1 Tax=Sorangium sp. So ce1036 TaxID=3133328 RepID=UPI003F0366A6